MTKVKYRTSTKVKIILTDDDEYCFTYGGDVHNTFKFKLNDKFVGKWDAYKLTSKTSAILIEYLPDNYILITDATWE
jgi:hypothetical protein